MPPKLSMVIRLDSLPLNQTYFTEEGYLIDRPILTSTGIFEYHNSDGSVRRELRLPEDVFEPDSLKSYKGHPIIITHDAGLVTKDNVQEHQIGTILTEGYRSGDDVRAEIVIHDTDKMKKAGLKELSLGYHVDLDETPGEWNGQHYDAIQRNIRINHLALVGTARAGEQARLNIDSRDPVTTLRGGKAMSNPVKSNAPADTRRNDGSLTPEEFAKAVEEYKARRAKQDSEAVVEEKPAEEVTADGTEEVVEEAVVTTDSAVEPTTEEMVNAIKERRDNRSEEDVADLEAAKKVILKQDEDMGVLFDIIDTMLAKEDFSKSKADEAEGEEVTEEGKEEDVKEDEAEEAPASEELEKEDGCADDETCKKDGEEDPVVEEKPAEDKATLNKDSIDEIVNQRIALGMLGRQIKLDGLEKMDIMDAKKAIVMAVRPGMRLDGRNATYINAAFDCAVADIQSTSEKDTNFQKNQMFNNDSAEEVDENSSGAARQRMIDRQQNKR